MPGRVRKAPEIFDPSPTKAAQSSPSDGTPRRAARKPRLPRSASAPPSAKPRRTKALVAEKAKKLVRSPKVAPAPANSAPLAEEARKLELIKIKVLHGASVSWKEVCETLGIESDEQTISAYKSVWQRFKSKWAHDVPAGIDELETELQGKKERRDRGGALLREMDVTHEELSPVAPEPVRLRTSPPAAQPKQKAAMKYFRINVYGASMVRGVG